MTRDPVWTDDCNAGHMEARTSELAFKLRTIPLPPQRDANGNVMFALGQCWSCYSSIGYAPDYETEVPNA